MELMDKLDGEDFWGPDRWSIYGDIGYGHPTTITTNAPILAVGGTWTCSGSTTITSLHPLEIDTDEMVAKKWFNDLKRQWWKYKVIEKDGMTIIRTRRYLRIYNRIRTILTRAQKFLKNNKVE